MESKTTDSSARTLFSWAAFFEDEFSIDWVLQLTGIRASVALEILENAVAENLLAKTGFSRYRFVDEKKRIALQKQVPADELQHCLHKVVDLLLRELPEGENKAGRIAGYLMHLKNDPDRCRWLIQAGDLYLHAFQTTQALQCFRKVLDDLDGRVAGGPIADLYIEAALKYSRIADIRFNMKEILAILHQALHHAELCRDYRAVALLQMHIAKNEWYRSNYREAQDRFERGWEIARESKDPRLKQSAQVFSTFFHYWQGRFGEAVAIFESDLSGKGREPQGRFHLMAESTVGNCYTMIGRPAQGFGMIQDVHDRATGRGDTFMEAFNQLVMAISLIDIQRYADARESIRQAFREVKKWPRSPLALIAHLLQAYVAFRQNRVRSAATCLKKFLVLRSRIEVSMWPYPYLLELSWAAACDVIPRIKGLNLESEIQRARNSSNLFMIGLACRFQALRRQQKGGDPAKIEQLLQHSEQALEQSGHVIELLRTRQAQLALAVSRGREEEVRMLQNNILRRIHELPKAMVPADLQPADSALETGERQMPGELLQAAEKIMGEPHADHLLNQLIALANRMIGAERGAVFVKGDAGSFSDLTLLASQHLTEEQMRHSGFATARQAMEEAVHKGEGIFRSCRPDSPSRAVDTIRSLVCLPLRFRNHIIGVLYHDNRMLFDVFQASHLERLAVIGAMISLVLRNRQYRLRLRSIEQGKLEVAKSGTQVEEPVGMIGDCLLMRDVFAQIRQVASSDATVLVLGETGTGKELVARAVHDLGNRRKGPFVSVNCNALPDSLISSELFGHEKGAFTGALARRVGRFERATGGTLFLDEIGELPLDTQVKLLRVLQTREFERIGGNRTIPSDFRLIAATNRDLVEEVSVGRFRADLYYRLNVFPITLPPLRDRKEDIPALARHFLQHFSVQNGKRFQSFPEEEMRKLLNYDWPGNVRELENVIERGTIVSSGSLFAVPDVLQPSGAGGAELQPEKAVTLQEMEHRLITRTLRQTNWKVRGPGGTAARLDIHPSTLYSRMKKLGIRRPSS